MGNIMEKLPREVLRKRDFLVEDSQTVVYQTLVMGIPGSSFAGIRPLADTAGGYQLFGLTEETVEGDDAKVARVRIGGTIWCKLYYNATTGYLGDVVYAYQVDSSGVTHVKLGADATNNVRVGKIIGFADETAKSSATNGAWAEIALESHFGVEHDTDTDTDTDTWATDNYNPALAVRTIAEAGDVDIIPAASHERALELVGGSLQLMEVPDSSAKTITGILKRGSDDAEMTDTLTFTEGTDGLWAVKDFTPTANVAVAADEKVYLTLGGNSSSAGAILPLLNFKTTDAPS